MNFDDKSFSCFITCNLIKISQELALLLHSSWPPYLVHCGLETRGKSLSNLNTLDSSLVSTITGLQFSKFPSSKMFPVSLKIKWIKWIWNVNLDMALLNLPTPELIYHSQMWAWLLLIHKVRLFVSFYQFQWFFDDVTMFFTMYNQTRDCASII